MSQNTNIREAIDAAVREQIGAVPTGYSNVVEAVKVAVEGLADAAVDSLTAAGRNLGATDQQMQDAFVSAGLITPEPEPEVAEPADGTEERLSKIEATLARLSAIAERAESYFGRR